MERTRKFFSHDELLRQVRESFSRGLKRFKIPDSPLNSFSNVDCLMSGLAIFTFKYPSLLCFDRSRYSKERLKSSLLDLFCLKSPPCDTQVRTRLDRISYESCRLAFTRIFSLLQRGKVLDHFRFLERYYLISLDGTGIFSSPKVHCEHCCVKEHRTGQKTYYHQILCGALVHPDQSVVFPFAPEPIMNTDGQKKNDCERNAAKRWLKEFKREHPHLPGVILGDGLMSNAPFIKELQSAGLRFILVCKSKDHRFLLDWLEAADDVDAPCFEETVQGVLKRYEYMRDVPLNDAHQEVRVSVVRYTELKKGRTLTWVWVTDLPVSKGNIREIVKGGRCRWKIENETFNTLKNQGYEFEHNFGHGKEYLSTVFAHLMLLSFFIDQCLQRLNKRFQECLGRYSKRELWEKMRVNLEGCWRLPNFETLYEVLIRPPPKIEIPAVAQ